MSLQYYSSKNVSAIFLVPLIAVAFSSFYVIHNTSVINNDSDDYLSLFLLSSSSSSSFSVSNSINGHHSHSHHRHHNKKKRSRVMSNICDDFPDGIPPPNTNTTSYMCVDRRGCCNFTTVQAAVNAVPDFSDKRTVIWINSGIY